MKFFLLFLLTAEDLKKSSFVSYTFLQGTVELHNKLIFRHLLLPLPSPPHPLLTRQEEEVVEEKEEQMEERRRRKRRRRRRKRRLTNGSPGKDTPLLEKDPPTLQIEVEETLFNYLFS
jgi:hypothetical protein